MRTELSENIKRLREKGFSYNLIAKELNCAKSTVAYHCGAGQVQKSKSRAYKRKNKQKELNKQNRIYLQTLAFRYKRICGCKHCGNKNPIVLQFDHKKPENKITTIAQMISDRYSVKVFKNEIRKCNILCANCHLIKTAKENNYFSYNYQKLTVL